MFQSVWGWPETWYDAQHKHRQMPAGQLTACLRVFDTDYAGIKQPAAQLGDGTPCSLCPAALLDNLHPVHQMFH